MQIFKKLFQPKMLEWWQVGILKMAVLLFGIAIGATWGHIFSEYTLAMLVAGLLGGVYVLSVWLHQ